MLSSPTLLELPMVTISVKHFCNDTTYIFHQLVSGGGVAMM